jgi:hypothetical protein
LSSEEGEDEEDGIEGGDEEEDSEAGLPDMQEQEEGSDLEAAVEDNEAGAGDDDSDDDGSRDSKDGSPQEGVQNGAGQGAAAQQRPVRTHRRANGIAAAAGSGGKKQAAQAVIPRPSVQAGPDTWLSHMERQLTDIEVAALQGTQRVKWTDLEEPGFQVRLWVMAYLHNPLFIRPAVHLGSPAHPCERRQIKASSRCSVACAALLAPVQNDMIR